MSFSANFQCQYDAQQQLWRVTSAYAPGAMGGDQAVVGIADATLDALARRVEVEIGNITSMHWRESATGPDEARQAVIYGEVYLQSDLSAHGHDS